MHDQAKQGGASEAATLDSTIVDLLSSTSRVHRKYFVNERKKEVGDLFRPCIPTLPHTCTTTSRQNTSVKVLIGGGDLLRFVRSSMNTCIRLVFLAIAILNAANGQLSCDGHGEGGTTSERESCRSAELRERLNAIQAEKNEGPKHRVVAGLYMNKREAEFVERNRT